MYNYETEKSKIFTEGGQVHFLKVRDQAQCLLKTAGAFRQDKISVSGDSWLTLACLDRLVELNELVKLRPDDSCWAQFQVYADPQVHNW